MARLSAARKLLLSVTVYLFGVCACMVRVLHIGRAAS